MKKIYPQEEERMHISDEKYLLFLKRQGSAIDNAMQLSDFSRNIWLMDGTGNEIWRIFSDSDDDGLEFTSTNVTNTEYIAYRKSADSLTERTFLIDIETGYATLYPEYPIIGHDIFAGPKLKLYTEVETRIYLNEEDYLLLEKNPPGEVLKRNIVRINGKGEIVWRITVPGWDDQNHYEFLRVFNGECRANVYYGRYSYFIDVDTGVAKLID